MTERPTTDNLQLTTHCVVIRNPASRHSLSDERLEQTLQIARDAGWRVECTTTDHEGHAIEIARDAAAAGAFVRIDMEDHTKTDATLAIGRAVRPINAGHGDSGVVIQAVNYGRYAITGEVASPQVDLDGGNIASGAYTANTKSTPSCKASDYRQPAAGYLVQFNSHYVPHFRGLAYLVK